MKGRLAIGHWPLAFWVLRTDDSPSGRLTSDSRLTPNVLRIPPLEEDGARTSPSGSGTRRPHRDGGRPYGNRYLRTSLCRFRPPPPSSACARNGEERRPARTAHSAARARMARPPATATRSSSPLCVARRRRSIHRRRASRRYHPRGSSRNALIAVAAASADPSEGQSASMSAASRSSPTGSRRPPRIAGDGRVAAIGGRDVRP